jgi:Uma2 family endonuclease
MVALGKPQYVTVDEFLRREREAETKSEYENGVIIAMAGASTAHNRIAFDLGISLGNQLRGTSCEPFGSDMRVRVSPNKYYYPDLAVVCGQPQEGGIDEISKPAMIVEVLSESTERRDPVVKFDAYRALPSLTYYVLIAQDRARAECFSRQPDGSWRVDIALGLEAALSLPAIGCELRLSEIYARVTFPPAEDDEAAGP